METKWTDWIMKPLKEFEKHFGIKGVEDDMPRRGFHRQEESKEIFLANRRRDRAAVDKLILKHLGVKMTDPVVE